jgi:hypothetical protein
MFSATYTFSISLNSQTGDLANWGGMKLFGGWEGGVDGIKEKLLSIQLK